MGDADLHCRPYHRCHDRAWVIKGAMDGIGRYIVTPDIFEILRRQPPGAGGEIQLADAINTQAARGAVEAVRLNGRRFDCGCVRGYLDAIMHVADRRGRDC